MDLFSVWEEMRTLRLSNSGPAPELWGIRIYLKRKTETKLRARHCSVSQSARVSAMAAMLHLVICSIKLNSGGENNVAGEIFMITRFCYLCLQPFCLQKFPLVTGILSQFPFSQVTYQKRLIKFLIRIALKCLVIQRCAA